MVERETFEHLVREAIASVPKKLQAKIENVVFVVEEDSRPPNFRERGIVVHRYLLGLYQGVPLPQRGVHYSLVLPDKITIFQKPIEELGKTLAGVRDLVHDVVHHEIGHYFGFSDAALHGMERTRKRRDVKKDHPR